jgi:hypothetical protein
MKRTLRLRRETLAELSAADLTSVAGGQEVTFNMGTCPIVGCVVDRYPSDQYTCLDCLTHQPACF